MDADTLASHRFFIDAPESNRRAGRTAALVIRPRDRRVDRPPCPLRGKGKEHSHTPRGIT